MTTTVKDELTGFILTAWCFPLCMPRQNQIPVLWFVIRVSSSARKEAGTRCKSPYFEVLFMSSRRVLSSHLSETTCLSFASSSSAICPPFSFVIRSQLMGSSGNGPSEDGLDNPFASSCLDVADKRLL